MFWSPICAHQTKMNERREKTVIFINCVSRVHNKLEQQLHFHHQRNQSRTIVALKNYQFYNNFVIYNKLLIKTLE